jgi:predicted nucleotidyltransferase component of viral defense system
MIGRDEIDHHAGELDVNPVDVERDYVFGWLLKAISENEYLGSTLIFKGGNAMRKAYYPQTRFSSDLDFAVEAFVDADRIVAELNAACAAVEADCGVGFVTDRTSLEASHALDKERTSYKGSVYFYDFYGKPSKLTISIRVDVSDYERVHLPLVTRPIHHPYSDATACVATVRCMALEELLANKLKCLLQRRHSFDLYDLVYATFSERCIEVDRGAVVRTFLSKTIFERSPGAARAILLGLPLAVLRGAFDKYVAAPVMSRFSFDYAVSAFTDVVQGFFEGFTSADRFEYAFFGPEHRNAIMEAGAAKRLLRLRYNGRDRIIEPYALAYKRAIGREPAEYFYAFDRSEHGSGPSIKSFLSRGVERLELLEEKFEPRYEIELAKAGEPLERTHFGQAFSGNTRHVAGRRPTTGRDGSRRRRPVRSPYALTVRVKCPYCEKIFNRSSYDTRLNQHKDRNGYRCHGRTGYIV